MISNITQTKIWKFGLLCIQQQYKILYRQQFPVQSMIYSCIRAVVQHSIHHHDTGEYYEYPYMRTAVGAA